MLFNKQTENGAGYDYSCEAERRPTSRPVFLKALRQRAEAPARSVIDALLTIMGDLECEGDIQVDGRVQGQVRCTQLIVGKDATINGDIVAEEVVVRGKVKGVIRANRVRLQETAYVEGEIFHRSLIAIEDGASFEGQIRRTSEPARIEGAAEDSPVARISETTDETGLVASLSCNPAEIGAKTASRSQLRREHEGRAQIAKVPALPSVVD
jgi:cytoskeletal protein CcmA (bactofilin family)